MLLRCRDGSEDAATALYLRYADRLQRLAKKKTDPKIAVRVDPEGVVQSVFRTFFRRISDGQYNVGKGEDLWNLLLVISLNKIRGQATRHRAIKRDATKTKPLQGDEPSEKRTSNQNALLVLQMTIDEILDGLTDSERQIVRLRIEGHEVSSIAEKTNRAKRSVERILQNFRSTLRSRIDEE